MRQDVVESWFWLSVRRLAFRAFMRSLLRLRSAFEKLFDFPFPAAPRMAPALISLPQWGQFIIN